MPRASNRTHTLCNSSYPRAIYEPSYLSFPRAFLLIVSFKIEPLTFLRYDYLKVHSPTFVFEKLTWQSLGLVQR